MKKGPVEIDLYEVWRVIKKNIALIIATCLLCGAVSFVAAGFVLPKKYQATTKIIVLKNETEANNAVTYNDLQTSQRLAETYRQIILSEAISDKVIANLNLKSQYNIDTNEYNKIVSVNTENSTEVVAIRVNTADPELSANIANEIVNVFISNIYSIYGVQNVSVLNKAKVPEKFTSPNVVKYTLVGLLVGVIASLIIIVIRLLIENKAKTEEDVKRIFELPIIGDIPDIKDIDIGSSDIKAPASLICKTHPDSIVVESFRILRTNLSLRDFDGELKIINIISPSQQEGKSYCAINLGYVYSQLNKKVLLIDLDLRLPSIHDKLKIKNKYGVTDIVNKNCTFAKAVKHFDDNFDVLTSGTRTVYASELIQSESFKRLIKKLRSLYDIILIDCPPLNMVTDGMITSTMADGTLMCVALNHDNKNLLAKIKDTISQLDINMLGIILTMSKMSNNAYGNGYGYAYGYGSKRKKIINIFKK